MTAHPITEELLTESVAVARIPGRDADSGPTIFWAPVRIVVDG